MEELNEDKKFKEAQVKEISNTETEIFSASKSSQKKKLDFYVELFLFLVLGILLGIALKTESVKRVTIGFDDYKMKVKQQEYDINALQANILEKQKEAARAQEEKAQQQNQQDLQNESTDTDKDRQQ